MTDWNELKRLAEEAGGIEWHADMAVANDGAESRAIYHRPTPNHVVEIIETPDSALDNADCIHSESVWQYIAAANPKTILALISENERLSEECEGCPMADAERLREERDSQQRICIKVMEERDQLLAEVEALRKDADRYRHLKDQGHFRAMSIDMGGNHSWTGMGRHVGKGSTVDEAIDAEIGRYRT